MRTAWVAQQGDENNKKLKLNGFWERNNWWLQSGRLDKKRDGVGGNPFAASQ